MDQTFVFADLAGFTAMTEAHGDEVAADVATAFCAELNRLLPPGGEDLKSLGDACMVRIPTAADAVRFGLRLVQEAATARPFPQVRVGMHTGPAVLRHGDWFGRTVNLAARVADQAPGGHVLLTDETRKEAGNPDATVFHDLGHRPLKNLPNPVHLLRALPLEAPPRPVPIDPVCRMRIPEGHELFHALGSEQVFCSRSCAERALAAEAQALKPAEHRAGTPRRLRGDA